MEETLKNKDKDYEEKINQIKAEKDAEFREKVEKLTEDKNNIEAKYHKLKTVQGDYSQSGDKQQNYWLIPACGSDQNPVRSRVHDRQ